MVSPIVEEIIHHTEPLPDALQRRVLELAKALHRETGAGVPGARLLRFAGAIPLDDLDIMRAEIERGCEQIDPDEW